MNFIQTFKKSEQLRLFEHDEKYQVILVRIKLFL